MNVIILLLAGIVCAVLLSRLAKYLLAKMGAKKSVNDVEKETHIIYEPTISKKEEVAPIKSETKVEESKIVKEEDFKKVLSKTNCDSSKKSKQINTESTEKDKTNKKHKKNYNRDKSGKFKSNKEWKKEQKTY